MGIFDKFRNPKSIAKKRLKQSLKDAQWKKDYEGALHELGVKTKPKSSIVGNNSWFYNGYNSNGGSKWPGGLSASGRIRYMDHSAMLQNARDVYHDSIDARAIVDRSANCQVDTGLVLNATPDSNILGISPEESESWGKNVSALYHLYCSDKKQHRSGTMNFYQSQHLYAIMQHRDGDMFVIFSYSKSKKLQNPLQWDFIDPNQISGCGYTSTYNNPLVDDGIIRNKDNSERAYKVWVRDTAKNYGYKEIIVPRIGEKSGRVMMLHGFNPEYPGQGRGYSPLGFAIQEIENITDFTLAQIKKAINQSNLIFSIENKLRDPGNAFAGLAPNISAIGEQLMSEPTVEELSRDIRVCPLPESNLNVPGSTAVVGNEQGDEIKMLANTTPAESFKEFVSVFLERLSAARGIPIEVVLMKFGQNYSASRATLILAWRVFQIWRQEMIVDYLDPHYESWLNEEIAAGKITAPGWQDPVLRRAWLKSNWIGQSMPSIDPGKEAKARKDNLEMNLTTIDRESRDLNGSDASNNIMKNKKTFPEISSPPWAKNSKTTGNVTDEKFKEIDDRNEDMEDDNG